MVQFSALKAPVLVFVLSLATTLQCQGKEVSELKWRPLGHMEHVHPGVNLHSQQSNEHSKTETSLWLPGKEQTMNGVKGLIGDLRLSDPKFYISEPCLNHTELFLQAVLEEEPWALNSKFGHRITLSTSVCTENRFQ